jgi:hypothetical protein
MECHSKFGNPGCTSSVHAQVESCSPLLSVTNVVPLVATEMIQTWSPPISCSGHLDALAKSHSHRPILIACTIPPLLENTLLRQ